MKGELIRGRPPGSGSGTWKAAMPASFVSTFGNCGPLYHPSQSRRCFNGLPLLASRSLTLRMCPV